MPPSVPHLGACIAGARITRHRDTADRCRDPGNGETCRAGKPGSTVISDKKLESYVFLCAEGAEAGVSVVSQWLV